MCIYIILFCERLSLQTSRRIYRDEKMACYIYYTIDYDAVLAVCASVI